MFQQSEPYANENGNLNMIDHVEENLSSFYFLDIFKIFPYFPLKFFQ